MSDRGWGCEFDRLVPRWMFALRSAPARVLAAVLIPVALAVPLVVIPDADDLRLGPYLVLGVVGVAAVAGWWATAVSGVIVIGLYWWYGVPEDRSFRLAETADYVALGAMALLVVGVTAMARRVERAVEDVRALDGQRRDRVAAEAASRRTAEQQVAQVEGVLELSNRLAAASTMHEVAQVAVDEIRLPVWPTTASIAVVRDDRLHVLAARGAAVETLRALEEVDVRSSSWLGEALEGRMILVDDRDEFARAHPDARALRLYPSGSWAVIPFRSESTIGLLSLYYVGPQELSLCAQHYSLIGELLAAALERARADELRFDHLTRLEQAFEERDRIARTLSTTLLPPRLPVLEGFTAAGWLVPAHADEVAGDFYDLFSVASGDWVAVLGDVCGKGAEAAAVTSLARYAARVAALEDAHPAHIAGVANAALVEDPSDLFCTMAIVRYRHDSDLLEVTLAGHPQMRVVSRGQVTRVGRFGAALGYAVKPPIVECRPLLPGDTVVLFSDGLIERNPNFDEDDLDRLLAGIPPGVASEVAEHIRARITEVPAARHDDLALLVIQRAP